MNWVLKIAPKKLKEIDIHLRENKPYIWATRIHLTLYLGILYATFAGLIGWITPIKFTDVLSQNRIEARFGIFLIPTIIFAGYLLIQLVLYNIEKRDIKTNITTSWLTFFLTYTSLVVPFLAPYTISFVLNHRTANMLSNEEVFTNRNHLAKAQYYTNNGPSEYYHKPIKTLEVEYLYEKNIQPYMYNTIDPLLDSIYHAKGIFKYSRPRLKKQFTSYYRYYWKKSRFYGDLDTLTQRFYDDQNKRLNLDSAQFYLNHSKNIAKRFIENKVLNIDSVIYENKNNIYFNTYSSLPFTTKYGGLEIQHASYELIDQAFKKNAFIILAKSNWIPLDLRTSVFWVIIGVVFCLTCLIFVFKRVLWQQFLLFFFSTGLIITLVTVITSIYRFKSMFVATVFLSYFTICFIGLNRIWREKQFSFWTNHMVMTAFYGLPYIPLFMFFYFKDQWKLFEHHYFDKYLTTIFNGDGTSYIGYSQEYYDLLSSIKFWSLWGGVLVFLILGLPYFYLVFKRLRALPKRK